MSDYIKREDALNAFRRVYMIPGQGTAKEIYAKQIENTYKQIESVPCADVVEQKHGKWIEYPECLQYDNAYSDDHIVCSECCHVWSLLDNCTETFNYCPNCGARMVTDDV